MALISGQNGGVALWLSQCVCLQERSPAKLVEGKVVANFAFWKPGYNFLFVHATTWPPECRKFFLLLLLCLCTWNNSAYIILHGAGSRRLVLAEVCKLIPPHYSNDEGVSIPHSRWTPLL